MSVEVFCRELSSLPVGKNDRQWFPRWIRRYASGMRLGKDQTLPVEEAGVIRFLKSLRANGVPAWQRLQAGTGDTHVMNRPGIAVKSPADGLTVSM